MKEEQNFISHFKAEIALPNLFNQFTIKQTVILSMDLRTRGQDR